MKVKYTGAAPLWSGDYKFTPNTEATIADKDWPYFEKTFPNDFEKLEVEAPPAKPAVAKKVYKKAATKSSAE